MAKKKPEIPPIRPSARPSDGEEPPESTRRCSFCGRPPEDTCFLIAGPDDIFICEICVKVCVKILADAREERG
jgi:hypothetical protein